ncbi:hypothetical protein Tco_1257044 [Tanacetum coccineum]
MDTSKNDLKLDSSLFEQFQKFLVMYEKFEIFLDMLEQLKKFLAFEPYAMSTSSKNGFASFSKWILDSGATHHMSYLLSQFISMNLNSSKSILAANGDSMPLVGIGSVDTPSIALSNVYYIPSLTMNLASVSKICDSGCDVNFSVSNCSIYDQKTQEVVGTGHRQGDLYVLDHFRDNHAKVAGKAVTTAMTITGSMHRVVHTSISLYRWYGFFLADARLRSGLPRVCWLKQREIYLVGRSSGIRVAWKKEAIWLRGLLEELGVELNSVAVNCDNQGAIHLSRNHVFHERTKHINVRYHFIREVLEAKTVEVLKVGTEHNVGDALTKVVPGHKLQHCLELLSVGIGYIK